MHDGDPPLVADTTPLYAMERELEGHWLVSTYPEKMPLL